MQVQRLSSDTCPSNLICASINRNYGARFTIPSSRKALGLALMIFCAALLECHQLISVACVIGFGMQLECISTLFAYISNHLGPYQTDHEFIALLWWYMVLVYLDIILGMVKLYHDCDFLLRLRLVVKPAQTRGSRRLLNSYLMSWYASMPLYVSFYRVKSEHCFPHSSYPKLATPLASKYYCIISSMHIK